MVIIDKCGVRGDATLCVVIFIIVMNDGRGRKHDLAILLYIVNETRTVIKQVLPISIQDL